MRLFLKTLPIIALGLTLSNHAQASSATAYATIDWSTFSVTGYSTGVGPAPTITWDMYSLNSSVSANAGSSNDSDNSSNWTDPVSAWAFDAPALAQATANAALHSNSTITMPSSLAHSSADRMGSFTVTGSGILVFSADYSLLAALSPVNVSNYAIAGVDFSVSKLGSPSNSQGAHAYESVHLNGSNAGILSENDTLYLAFFVNDGDQFGFSAEAYTKVSLNAPVNAPVPLPPAAWLFISSIIGFIGISRRKSSMSV